MDSQSVWEFGRSDYNGIELEGWEEEALLG